MGTFAGIVLRSNDRERLKAFYECLGMKFEIHKHGEGPEHASFVVENSTVLEIYKRSRPKYIDDAILVVVSSVAKTLAQLRKGEFIPRKEKGSKEADLTQVYISDPDGRPVLLLQEAEGET
jgi:lactoylglutathione lyase